MNVSLRTLDVITQSRQGKIDINDHWMERLPGLTGEAGPHLSVVAELTADRNGLDSLKRYLGTAAIELGEPICLSCGLRVSLKKNQ